MKTQTIRLVDVFLLGPFMMWAAGKLRSPARELMLVSGLATIVFNAHNYAAIERGKEPLP